MDWNLFMDAVTADGHKPAAKPQSPQPAQDSGFFNTIAKSLSGMDSNGQYLQGKDLQNFYTGNTLGAMLGGLGQIISPQGFSGRLGEGVQSLAAGNLLAMNAARQQLQQNNLLSALLGRPVNPTTAPQDGLGQVLQNNQASVLDTPVADSRRRLDDLINSISRDEYNGY